MELTSNLRAKFMEHVGKDVETYPATCNDVVSACNNMSEFTGAEKEWFSKNLPHGTFNSPAEIKKALQL